MFETADYEAAPVMLNRVTWHTKAGNDELETPPEIRSYLEDVKAAIQSSDLVFQSTRDERSWIFYRLRAGRGDFDGEHPVVVVKYLEQGWARPGYVSTMYLSRDVYSQGALLWPRAEISSQ